MWTMAKQRCEIVAEPDVAPSRDIKVVRGCEEEDMELVVQAVDDSTIRRLNRYGGNWELNSDGTSAECPCSALQFVPLYSVSI